MVFIKKVYTNGKMYYYIVESYRVGNKSKHRVLKKLNPGRILSPEEENQELARFKKEIEKEVQHQIRDAVILAAGKATRLYPFTTSTPATLLEIGGMPLIEHTIKNLLSLGIRTIYIVTGFEAIQFHELRNRYRRNVNLLFNPFFDISGSLASFWIVKDYIKDSFVCLYGDVVFGKNHLKKLLVEESEVVITSVDTEPDYEAERVRTIDGNVLQLNVNIPDREVSGEFTGLVKFHRTALKKVIKALEQLEYEDNFIKLNFPALIERMVHLGYRVKDLRIKDNIWTDIDTPEELKKARERFQSSIM